MDREFIMAQIPHRPPFLWLDRVMELTENSIRAEMAVSADLEIFKGHYPDYPIMPGVLLCEAVFQAGALLISKTLRKQQELKGVPVLTRIIGAKFKREVRPGDRISIVASLQERIGPAWFLKGSVQVQGKTAVQVEFACALKEG
jgi:3-hydroxyacyl-[acyl-carrier-protein] dehydratase